MTLSKSKSEEKADVLLRVMQRGRASLREASIVLGKSWPTIKAHVELGKINTVLLGTRHYLTLRMLVEEHGLVLPYLPELAERVKYHLSDIDANEANQALGDDYD